MKRSKSQSLFVSDVSSTEYPTSEKVNIRTLKGTLADFIHQKYPKINEESFYPQIHQRLKTHSEVSITRGFSHGPQEKIVWLRLRT